VEVQNIPKIFIESAHVLWRNIQRIQSFENAFISETLGHCLGLKLGTAQEQNMVWSLCKYSNK